MAQFICLGYHLNDRPPLKCQNQTFVVPQVFPPTAGDLHIKYASFMKKEIEERACLTYFLFPLTQQAPAGQPSLSRIARAAGAMLPALGQSSSLLQPAWELLNYCSSHVRTWLIRL